MPRDVLPDSRAVDIIQMSQHAYIVPSRLVHFSVRISTIRCLIHNGSGAIFRAFGKSVWELPFLGFRELN